MKTLRQIIELYTQDTKDGKAFVAKHKVKQTPDANKNGDDVFKASNVKDVTRQPEHGYDPGQDEKVYEEVELDEGDVIQFPKRNKKNDEEEKRNKEDRKIPGWMLRHPDAKPLLKKLQQIQARKERERKFREDEAKEFGESTQIDELDDAAGGYPVNKKPNTTPRPKAQVRTTVGKDGKETTHVILPGEKVVEAITGTGYEMNDEDLEISELHDRVSGVPGSRQQDRRPVSGGAITGTGSQEGRQAIHKSYSAPKDNSKDDEFPMGGPLRRGPRSGPPPKTPKKPPGFMPDRPKIKPQPPKSDMLSKPTPKVIMAGYELNDENLEINEVLKPSMGVKAYIDDFVKSDDPRFEGASKKDRIKRALAAYYSAKRGD